MPGLAVQPVDVLQPQLARDQQVGGDEEPDLRRDVGELRHARIRPNRACGRWGRARPMPDATPSPVPADRAMKKLPVWAPSSSSLSSSSSPFFLRGRGLPRRGLVAVLTALGVGRRLRSVGFARRLAAGRRARRRRPPSPASTASSNASCSSGVTSCLVSLMSGCTSSALRNCFSPDLALLEADDGDDAEVDVRARADRVLVQARARAHLQRFLQQRRAPSRSPACCRPRWPCGSGS